MTDRIALVTHLPASPSIPYYERGATALGRELRVFAPEDADAIQSFDPVLVVTRLGSSADEEHVAAIATLERSGLTCKNSSEAIAIARDKSRVDAAFATAGVPTPITRVLCDASEISEIERALGPPPWVVKRPIGTQGAGVALVADVDALRASLAGEPLLLVQEFIEEAGSSDLRVLVVAGRALAAIRRRGAPGDFRSNLHLGGTAETVALSAELARVAERASSAVGLDIAGIDILESRRGPLAIEANAAPGLGGAGSVLGEDLGTLVLERLLMGSS